jgi:Transglutaminase-like superfamily
MASRTPEEPGPESDARAARRRRFAAAAREERPDLSLLCLLVAAEADPGLDEAGMDAAQIELDRLAGQLPYHPAGGPGAWARNLAELLGTRCGFGGSPADYRRLGSSLLHEVLRRRRGLPILLSVVYVEVARRAGVALAGVGLPGHYVVGHFGASPPLLLDPFAGGAPVEGDHPPELVRPWGAHETALRILNNLVGSYRRRGDVGAAITAARMRLELPLDRRRRDALDRELRAIRARLN